MVPEPREALTVAPGARHRVEVAFRRSDTVNDQEPGDTVWTGVGHHRLQELVDSHLGVWIKDLPCSTILLHVEGLSLSHSSW